MSTKISSFHSHHLFESKKVTDNLYSDHAQTNPTIRQRNHVLFQLTSYLESFHCCWDRLYAATIIIKKFIIQCMLIYTISESIYFVLFLSTIWSSFAGEEVMTLTSTLQPTVRRGVETGFPCKISCTNDVFPTPVKHKEDFV